MTFLQIKQLLRTLSGRYDLVDDDTSGAIDRIINEASKYLDRTITHQKSYGSHFAQIAIDAFTLQIPTCRSIKEVWVSNVSGTRWQLEKMDLQELIPLYLAGTPESGETLYYAPVVTRKVPDDADLSAFSDYLQYLDTTVSEEDYTAIVIVPPTSAILVAEVKGLFYSPELSADSDENYWTNMHPLTLIKASLYQLEIFNQNKTKTKLWHEALTDDLTGIGKDLVEEIIAEVDQIEN